MPNIDPCPALTTATETHLLGEFAKWLREQRQARCNEERSPWQFRLFTRAKPGLREFTVELGTSGE